MATKQTAKKPTAKKPARKSSARSTSHIKTSVTHVESDGAFFLKLVLFLIVSSMWLRLEADAGTIISLPIGAMIAVFYALHDHFQIDRKIELALILVAALVSFWLPIGIYVAI